MADQRPGMDSAPPLPFHVVPDFDSQSMAKLIALVVERHADVRDEVTQALQRAGVRKIHGHASVEDAIAQLGEIVPDLVVIGDDVAPSIFDFVRDIRHLRIGANPFALIATLISQDNFSAVDHAVQAGTDDIIVKPVKGDQLVQRLKRVSVNRQPFVVTSDYLGPDRRSKARPSSVKRLTVPNTMLEKAAGKDVSTAYVKASVAAAMDRVLQARLKSHGYRAAFVCNLLIDAYRHQRIDASVGNNLYVLVDLLRDAAKTAERIGQGELVILCGSLSRDVEAIAGRFGSPTPKDLALIHKLGRAVLAAIDPDAQADVIIKETQAAAQTHLLRRRKGVARISEIHRAADEAPVATVVESVVDILPLDRGQVLFAQGEPATSAYILVSGQVGIYRDIGSDRVPVTKIRKGEFFGEMAIIDGTPRRATAIALEPSTVSIVAKDMIEEKMRKSDGDAQAIVHMLIDGLRQVPEKYAARSRHVSDVLAELSEQVARVRDFVEAPAASNAIRDAAGHAVRELVRIAAEIGDLVGNNADADRRTAALPPANAVQLNL